MLTKKQIRAFQEEILDWYMKNQRDLPWRKSHDPYNILVSEVMSQQTQISRVIHKYETWINRFPTLQSLAEASTREVLQYWSGLGYNRRALYLKKCAEEIIKNPGGLFPKTEEALKKLPGIGEYTARALLCFAFDFQIAVIDTNVKKVIAVKFFQGIVPEQKVLANVADAIVPQGRAYEWNQALMDYASEVLKEHKISIPKQSKFKNSDRYYRGQIVKKLIEVQTISCAEIERYIQEINNVALGLERLEKIIKSLEKDTFIRIEKGFIRLL